MAYAFERTGAKGTRYTGIYLDPDQVKRSAGTYRTRREALKAAHREEEKVRVGSWHDTKLGEVPFRTYVETGWLPSRHIEASTRAGYLSYLHTHFYPFFGHRHIGQILPSDVQAWVTKAAADGLSAASIGKYHMMLHSIFRRAIRDRIITFNPCEETELPKTVKHSTRTLTPEEYQHLYDAIPARHQLMVQTAIETGLRWGELIALRPRHLDPEHRTLTVCETIAEIPKRALPDGGAHGGQRMVLKPYPKDNEPRTMGLLPALAEAITTHISAHHLGPDDLLFPTRAGTPISRNTFRTRVWLPAVRASDIGWKPRFHDLRHAHASWLLAGGSDLRAVMDRMGHTQITTTQKYLHPLPDTDQRNLDAFNRITGRALSPVPD